MSNDQCRRNDEIRIANMSLRIAPSSFGHSDFILHSCFVIARVSCTLNKLRSSSITLRNDEMAFLVVPAITKIELERRRGGLLK